MAYRFEFRSSYYLHTFFLKLPLAQLTTEMFEMWIAVLDIFDLLQFTSTIYKEVPTGLKPWRP